MITGTTRLFAIIGDPIAHVRTPMAFNDYFAARNIDAVCVPIHILRDDLPRGWAGLKAIANMDGFIVTAPHKAESARLCDRLEGDGIHTKVVNTVRREKDGTFQRHAARRPRLCQRADEARSPGERPPLLPGRRRRRRHRAFLRARRQRGGRLDHS